MKTTPLISLAACAGLLLSGCQYKNSAGSPTYTQGTGGLARRTAKGKIHVVWAKDSLILPMKWYVDGGEAGLVPGTKSVTRTKHWVSFYNIPAHSAFPRLAIPIDLSPGSNGAEATIEVKVTQSASSPRQGGFDNNSYSLQPYGFGTGTTGSISTVWASGSDTTATVNWYRNGTLAGTVPSKKSLLTRTNHNVHFYNTRDHTTFPIPDLPVRLKPSPNERDATIKVNVLP